MTGPGARARRLAIAAPLVLMALIFGLSSLPLPAAPVPSLPHLDKVVHALLYGTLGALVARALVVGLGHARASWPAAVLVATLYGATDELHQGLVPGRTPSWGDLAADAAGSLVGATAWALRPGIRRSRGAER